jgi:Tol biopolymer transport system component
VWGDRVAWLQPDGIWIHEAGAVRKLVPGPTPSQSAPSLGGNTLVYLDNQSNSPAVHVYDLLSRAHTRVLTRPDAIGQLSPHTDGTSVAFSDSSGGRNNVVWSLSR